MFTVFMGVGLMLCSLVTSYHFFFFFKEPAAPIIMVIVNGETVSNQENYAILDCMVLPWYS